MTYPQLELWFEKSLGEPRFRASQVWQWLWRKMATSFDEMTDVSRRVRERLRDSARILWPEIRTIQTGADGTTKFLLALADGASIETVLIPAENRAGVIRWSQCISTQAGCPMGCAFCATGQQGFTRNLRMAEIAGQVLIGRKHLEDYKLDSPILRNLVFMGMGEPLLNLGGLLPALRTLSHEKGMNFSPRRMTVSTCGIKEGLRELGDSGLAYLAVSLHAADQALRSRIMPAAARWPLEEMISALQSYPLKTRERITFEYLLLGGVNDELEHAKDLVRLLSHVKSKVNLIVYNPSPGLPFRTPSPERVAAFQKYLCDRHITAILRKSRGADICAACGQLRALSGAL